MGQKKLVVSDIAWANVRVTLGQLEPWSDNPRMSSKKQAARILESFKTFGQVQTVAVSPALDVYDGHQRLSALLTLYGKDCEIDARQSSRALTDDERRRLVIALHAGATGAWDWDALSGWDETLLAGAGMDADLLAQMNRDAVAVRELLNVARDEYDFLGSGEAEPEAGATPTDAKTPSQQDRIPLAIVLNTHEKRAWDKCKARLEKSDDKSAFLAMVEVMNA